MILVWRSDAWIGFSRAFQPLKGSDTSGVARAYLADCYPFDLSRIVFALDEWIFGRLADFSRQLSGRILGDGPLRLCARRSLFSRLSVCSVALIKREPCRRVGIYGTPDH
jgi:hypothetical protein